MTFQNGQSLSLFVDQAAFNRSTHGNRGMRCAACHPNNQRYPHPHVTAMGPRELSRSIVRNTCFGCHEQVFRQFKESVHGKALIEEGNLDVPGCPDCHGVHNIRDPHTNLFRMESPDTCSKCHADPTLAARYGISPNVTQSYLKDFHGTSIRLTRDKSPDIASYKPVCYDCHGIHDIKKVDDPSSRVVKQNLAATCRRCHPGADASFPAAWTSHYEPDRSRWPLVYWINTAYKILIPGIIGPMVLYILLDLFRTLVHRIRGGGARMSSMAHEPERQIVRFTLVQRIEHAVQILSFTALVVTGVSQKLNAHPAAEWIILHLGGIEVVRAVHRSFAVLLILEAIFHVSVIGWTVLARKQHDALRAMAPTMKDVRDAAHMVLYFVGLRKERARFDRYDFRQKFEYLSLAWGTVVMVITGLIMWFPVQIARWTSGEMIPAAKAAHGGEGLLAFLAILIWHMYSAHLSPEVFPIDTTIFTGKISERRMLREHPIEYERILEQERAAARSAPHPADT